ncbi:MAG: LEA type 2 family protein [Methanomicrobiales archaeon]|nr:LEA type 2 family protein [Methanomicrobiales archaeon]
MQPESWVLVFFFIAAAVIVSGCSMLLKEPDVSVKAVSPVSVGLRELVLDVTLDVYNPNAVGITLKTLSFDVFYQKRGAWVFLSHGEQTGITIRPGSNEVTVPVSVENSALLGSLFEVVTQGEITLKIDGFAAPDFRLFAPKVPFSRTVTVSL